MNFSLHVVQIRGKGVEVATPTSTAETFWLPRNSPVVWSEPPEPGAKVNVTVPRWLAQKHKQLVVLRGQYALPLIPVPGLDPEKAKGPIPMADSNECRGVLFREQNKKSEKAPDMTGHLTIDGVRYRLAGWTREGKDGRKFLSIAASLPEDRGDDRRQQSDRHRSDNSSIPF